MIDGSRTQPNPRRCLMVTLELTAEEAEQLRFILTSYLTDLRSEVRATVVRSFRAQLEEREVFIRKLLQHLPTTVEPTTT
jgi:hypothetical protein